MADTVLVTGATGAIGAAIVRRLAADGLNVAIAYHRGGGVAAELVEAATAAGVRGASFAVDLSDAADAVALVERVEDALGPPLVFVHAAGRSAGGVLMARNHPMLAGDLAVNLGSAIHIVAELTPLWLQARRGRAVFIGSPTGSGGGLQGQSAYAATKAGLVGLARTIANELSPRANITANVVSPGVVPSRLSAFGIEEMGELLRQHIPLGRFGEPEEVAELVAYLISDDGAYINGAEIPIDGGYSLKHVSRRRRRASEQESP
jgi:beta-ketoacyl ACP reductase